MKKTLLIVIIILICIISSIFYWIYTEGYLNSSPQENLQLILTLDERSSKLNDSLLAEVRLENIGNAPLRIEEEFDIFLSFIIYSENDSLYKPILISVNPSANPKEIVLQSKESVKYKVDLLDVTYKTSWSDKTQLIKGNYTISFQYKNPKFTLISNTEKFELI